MSEKRSPEYWRAYRRSWNQTHREKNREYQRQYREKNKEQILQKQRAWAKTNRGRYNARANDWRRKYPQKAREAKVKWKFGLEPERYRAMLLEQGGRCAICRIAFSTHVDHDHKTGKVRGLLCHECNTGLGFFRDDPVRLELASEYLKKYD